MNSEQGYKLTPQLPSASQRARNSITVLQFIPKGSYSLIRSNERLTLETSA